MYYIIPDNFISCLCTIGRTAHSHRESIRVNCRVFMALYHFYLYRCRICEERFPSLVLLEYHKEDEDHWSYYTDEDCCNADGFYHKNSNHRNHHRNSRQHKGGKISEGVFDFAPCLKKNIFSQPFLFIYYLLIGSNTQS